VGSSCSRQGKNKTKKKIIHSHTNSPTSLVCVIISDFYFYFYFYFYFFNNLIFYSLLQNSRRVDLGNCLAQRKEKIYTSKLVAHPHVTLRNGKFTYQVDNRRKV
jgi:hypothetical protein